MMQQEIAAATYEMLPRATWMVKTHPPTPVPETTTTQLSAIDPGLSPAPRISAVGIGEFGANGARLLSRNIRGVTCCEVTLSPSSRHGEQLSLLLSSLQQSDLIFILTEMDDPECAAMAQLVGRASCGAGVLTVAIDRLGLDMVPPERVTGEEQWYDSIFSVSGRSLPVQPEPIIPEGDALTGYAIRHMVASITSLIVYQSGICIDFADVTAIMREGRVGSLGVGVGSGDSRAVTAAKGAIGRLEDQGVSLAQATGVLVSVHGSSTLTMDDFDEASRFVHHAVNDKTNILVGLISDEQMGYNVKVTVMAVSTQSEKLKAC